MFEYSLNDLSVHLAGGRIIDVDGAMSHAERVHVAWILRGDVQVKWYVAMAQWQRLPDALHEMLWLQPGRLLAFKATYRKGRIVGHLPFYFTPENLPPGVPQGLFRRQRIVFPRAHGL